MSTNRKTKTTAKYLEFLIELSKSKSFNMNAMIIKHRLNHGIQKELILMGFIKKVSKGKYEWSSVTPSYKIAEMLRSKLSGKSMLYKESIVKKSNSRSLFSPVMTEEDAIQVLRNSDNKYEVFKYESKKTQII